MADIRINSLSTTASASSSDDFIALDGTTNGTRKLNAYSPTFGGNLTVNGGTIGTAASTNLTLNGGSSGASLVLGQGTNGSATANPKGTGFFVVQGVGSKTSIGDFTALTSYAALYQGVTTPGAANYVLASNGSELVVNAPANGNPIRFQTNTAEAARLTSAGNLLIGTTTDGGQKLQVAGNAAFSGALTASGGSVYSVSTTGSLTSSANNDVMSSFRAASSWSNAGGYTNVTTAALYVPTQTFAGAFGYGLFIGNVTGATNNYAIRTTTGRVSFEDTTASTSTSTGALVVGNGTSGGLGVGGAAFIGGNLTVSGTGTSTFASNLTLNGSKILTVNGSGNLVQIGDASGTVAILLNRLNTSSNSNFYWLTAGALKWAVGVGINAVGEDFEFYSYPAGNTLLKLGSTTGNLLLGTTTDSGNGKLQLATHTSNTGGIGFGTDTALYRYGGGILGIDHIGGSVPGLTLLANGTRIISIYGASNSLYLDTFNAAGAMYLRTGAQTTALTLDSSQRCILAGALRLNNAYTAGAPTATGYVTIQDSAGNTYKVLVGT